MWRKIGVFAQGGGWETLRDGRACGSLLPFRFSPIEVEPLRVVENRMTKANASLPTAPSIPPLLPAQGRTERRKNTCPLCAGQALGGPCPWVRLIQRQTAEQETGSAVRQEPQTGLRFANRQERKDKAQRLRRWVRSSSRSAGIGAENSSRSPDAGCVKPSDAACRAWPCSFKPPVRPYIGSPTRG